MRCWAFGVFSWQHFFLKSTTRPSTYLSKARYPLKSHCISSRILQFLFGRLQWTSGSSSKIRVQTSLRAGCQKKSTRKRSVTTTLPGFLWPGQASLHLHFSFFLSLFFLLPSQQGICCFASQPSDGNLQFSLQGHGQTKGLTLRYTVVLIGSESLTSRMTPNDELEIQNQGSLEMSTRQLLAHQKNN